VTPLIRGVKCVAWAGRVAVFGGCAGGAGRRDADPPGGARGL